MPLRIIRLLLIALLTMSPLSARAQGTDAAAAETLFQRGRDAMAQGDLDEACQYFDESFALDPAVGTVLNLATCEEKRGHLAASWERWHQALDLMEEDDDRVPFARAQLDSLESRIAHLRIVVEEGTTSDLIIERDGVTLGTASLGLSLPADPGEHVIVVKSKHHEPKTYTISLEVGQSEELVVSPGPPLSNNTRSQGGGARRAHLAGGIAGLSLGVAGVATAVVTGALLPQQRQKVLNRCPGGYCDPAGAQELSRVRTLLAVNMIGWIAGGVGLATGGVLLFTLPKKTKSAPTDSATSAQRSTQPTSPPEDAALALRYVGNGLQLSGTF